jgi:uncharacterized protein YoxC
MAYNYEYPYTDPHRYNADWLLNRMKELNDAYDSLMDRMDTLEGEFSDLSNAYVTFTDEINEKIRVLNSKVDAFFIEINNTIDQKVNTLFDAYAQELNERINRVIAEINATLAQFERDLELVKEYSDIQNDELWHRVNQLVSAEVSEIEKQIEEIKQSIIDAGILVYDPASGFYENTETAIKTTYEDNKVEALTVQEYATLGLTVNQYKSYLLTTRQYDNIARRFLFWDDRHKVCDPIDGHYRNIDNVLSHILTFGVGNRVTRPYSVNEYNALNLTVEDYANLSYTCYGYLFDNGSSEAQNEVTVDDYASLEIDNVGTIFKP